MKKSFFLILSIFACLGAVAQSDGIVMTMVPDSSGNWLLSVSLNNPTTSYSAFQIDLQAPAELSFDASSLQAGTRASELSLSTNATSSGLQRVVGYASASSSSITGSSGTLFSIGLRAAVPLSSGSYDVTAKNVRFSQTDGTENVLPGLVSTFTVGDSVTFTITWWSQGQVYRSQMLEAGDSIPAIDEPAAREGYTFCGWGDVPAVMPNANLNLYATWCAIYYNLSYVVDGDTVHSEQVAFGSGLPAFVPEEREGYEFAGWKDAPQTMPASDLALQAQWRPSVYAVTYIVGGEVVHTDSVSYGEALTLFHYIPADTANYVFSGWTGDTLTTMPAHDLTYEGSLLLLGDVNLDGVVNSSDAVAIYNYISDGEQSNITLARADLTGDGIVNTADITALYNRISNSAPLSSPAYRKAIINDWRNEE